MNPAHISNWTENFRALFLGILLLLASWAAAETREQKAGREQHEELAQTMHFYQDQKLVDYVQSVGEKLALNSNWSDIPYHFFIVDDPGINAFATQGGYVYINRGLLTHMTSEAQLAAVLAHEIAHITERHVVRSNREARLGQAASILAELVTMNSDIGDTVDLWTGIRVFGHGREMELEADRYGAQYLYKTGYDPQAIIEVLSLLKDHETFVRSSSYGGGGATYHGLFSSHPRSDQRLREVISQAGSLPPGENTEGREVYREMTEGLIFGENPALLAPEGWKRYTNKSLAITFIYPAAWSIAVRGSTITATSSDFEQQFSINVGRRDASQDNVLESMTAIFSNLDNSSIQPVHPDSQEAPLAATAVTGTGDQRRVAAVSLGSYLYKFEGDTLNSDRLHDEIDATFIEMISSFRRAAREDLPPEKILRITYERAAPGETFEEMAMENPVMGADTANLLRLINGYYPDGEPQPGIWIKLLRKQTN